MDMRACIAGGRKKISAVATPKSPKVNVKQHTFCTSVCLANVYK